MTTYQSLGDAHEDGVANLLAHEDRNPHEDSWACCCGKFSNDHVKYMVQVGVGSAVMLFSMIQIIRAEGDTTVYYSMLSGTMGLFLPSPGMPIIKK